MYFLVSDQILVFVFTLSFSRIYQHVEMRNIKSLKKKKKKKRLEGVEMVLKKKEDYTVREKSNERKDKVEEVVAVL